MWSGSIPFTRIARLANHLPAGARIWESLGTDHAWDASAHLLAGIADTLNWANYQRGDGKGTKPEPLPRPTQIKAKLDAASHKEKLAQEAARRMRNK